MDRIAGTHDATPLWLGLAAACGVLFMLDRLLAPAVRGVPARAAWLGLVALLVPLPALVFSGMEATLHVLLALALAFGAAAWMLGRRRTGLARGAGMAALAALCVLTRFESLFLIACLAGAALLRGRTVVALALATGAAAALGGYAALALSHGGPWLPIPVLLDSHAPVLGSPATWVPFLRRLPVTLAERHHWHMPALLLGACGILLLHSGEVPERVRVPRLVLACFVPALLLHVLFAGIGAFFRYEAYLVAIGLAAMIAVAAGGRDAPPDARGTATWRAALAALAALVLAAPLFARGVVAVRNTSRAEASIYRQQVQMSRFVHDYFRGQTVAINDLGAVSWYGGAKVIDLVGLATPAVADARIAGRFFTPFIDSLCSAEHVRVALLYAPWFAGDRALPSGWRAVARWSVPEAIVLGGTTVTIYATTPGAADSVRDAVRAFGARLPPGVRAEIVGADRSLPAAEPAVPAAMTTSR